MVDVTGYTQAGADSLLALKANTADLAAVATSGAYGDLTGKPTIPAAQVASDWTASTGVAAILNKPTLGTAAAQDVSAFATAAQGTLATNAVPNTRTVNGKALNANITLAASDVGALTQTAADARYVQPGSLATVATTGSYNDLTNKPAGAYAWAPQVGDYWQLTRSSNAATKFAVGTELAVGITMPAVTIDKLTVTVTNSGAAGSTMLVGLRAITGNPSTYGAPLFTAAIDTSVTGAQTATITATAIPAGMYALCWCQSVDSATTATVQYATFDYNANLIPLARATSLPATGHGPVHAILNTGVTSTTTLPSTVVVGNVTANQANNAVPQIILHRSA